ncbi:MAG: diguanylate cyclase [Planctomycetota bacterium]|nr:MAG: diguanylate cyclase [Planctomycetota bacterium]
MQDEQARENRATRLLVLGPQSLKERIAEATDGDVCIAEHPLDGVWRCGQARYDGVAVSLSLGNRALPAIRGLRRVAPQARIVVVCDAHDEPIARQSLDEGADDYLIEPLRDEDVRRAFQIIAPEDLAPAAPLPAEPTPEELNRLSEILRRLDDGPLRSLERLADLLMCAFDARGVVLQLEGLAAAVGDPQDIVIEEIVRRDGRVAGRVALARRRRGAYPSSLTTRLSEYIRLIDATFQQARERQRWRELAWRDDLSGLYNRRYFDMRLRELIEDARRRRAHVTVFFFDIDDFKSYNDTHGHEVGDQLIRETAELLRGCTRDNDIVARFGGDEFAVIFWDAEQPRVPGSRHPREFTDIAERFRRSIVEHNFSVIGPHSPGAVTISGGLATFPWAGDSAEALLRAADQALLLAKRTGKNAVRLAESESENPPADRDASVA